MKTRLNKFEDFMAHLKENAIKRAYFALETRSEVIPTDPPQEVPKMNVEIWIGFTAKTEDDKKHFSFITLLKDDVISNPDESKKFDEAVLAERNKLIADFQDRYPSCFLIDGVIE